MTQASAVAAAIADLYRAPLEEFISRRDALVRQLRAEKRRDEATQAKALRKPNRTAWVLDQVAFDDDAPIEQLATAIVGAQTQSGQGGSLRQALQDVQAAVRGVAHAGARVAIRAGHPIDASALVGAVLAVMGDANAFAQMRAGRLVDIPEGGGLDILAAIPVASTTAPKSDAPKQPPANADKEVTAAAARAELRKAEAAVADTRSRAQAALRAASAAEKKLEVAEQQLQRAQAEADAMRVALERARAEAESAAAAADDAARAADEIRARLE
jgi:hypothetical protein